MDTILLAIDGSSHARRATEHVIRLIRKSGPVHLHVVHVQLPLPLRSQAFMSDERINDLYEQEARQRCASTRGLLDAEKIAYTWHLEIGDPVECIVALADVLGADAIVLGTRSMGALANLALGSVATKVIHAATAPVTLVRSPAIVQAPLQIAGL